MSSVLILTVAFGAGHAGAKGAAMDDEILRAEKEIFEAIRKKDTAALDRALTEGFLLHTPGAPVVPKSEFLKSVRAIPVEILEVWSTDMAVHRFGNVGVLTGTQLARTRDASGGTLVSAQAFTDVFVHQENRWLLALAHSVEIPAPEKSR